MCTCGMTEMKRSGSAKYLLLSNIVTNYENFQVFKLQYQKNVFCFFFNFYFLFIFGFVQKIVMCIIVTKVTITINV